VHAWLWDDDKTAYIFTGDADEPMRKWRSRDEFESQLNDKLRSLSREPANKGLSLVAYKEQARAVAITWVKRLVARGYRVLSNRDRASHCGGTKKRRPCYVPTPWGLQWFPSVSAAARALQVDSSTVWHKCNNKYNNDYYWDMPELSERSQQLTDALRFVVDDAGGIWEGTARDLWVTWNLDRDKYGDIAERWRSPRELCKSLLARQNQLICDGLFVEIEGKDNITIESIDEE
jgi:hypothetical protein